MKSLKGAFALGLLPTTAIAQSVVTIRLPTCIPGDTGVISGPEVISVTTTNSLGSVIIEPITEVATPGGEPSTFVSQITTTNSLGSTVVETTTGITTAPVQPAPPNSFTTAITTTNSLGSSVVVIITSTSPAASVGPIPPATSVGPSPVGPASVGPSPVGPASVGPSPVGPASVGPASVGPSPVGPASVGPAPPPPPPPATTPKNTPVPATTATGPPPHQTVNGTPSCPGNNGSYYETVFYNTYEITCGLELVGTSADEAFHADTYVACLESCDLLVGCVAVTWPGGADPSTKNCYPYYSVNGTKSAGPNSELLAGQNVNGPNPGTDTPDDYCDPAGANGTVITDLFGKAYYIGCSQQINSPNLLVEVTTTNMEACIEYCSICETCVAIGWTGPHVAGIPNDPNCFTFASNNITSYNATVNYALLNSLVGTPY